MRLFQTLVGRIERCLNGILQLGQSNGGFRWICAQLACMRALTLVRWSKIPAAIVLRASCRRLMVFWISSTVLELLRRFESRSCSFWRTSIAVHTSTMQESSSGMWPAIRRPGIEVKIAGLILTCAG